MATRTIKSTGGSWLSTGTWVEGVVPTVNDTVVATSSSGNLTINSAGVVCGSMDLTNYVGTLTFTSAKFLTIGSNSLGSLVLSSGMTLTMSNSSYINLISTSSAASITANGKSINWLKINSVGNVCTYTLQSDLIVTTFEIDGGSFNANNKNITDSTSTSISTTGTVNMGSGSWSTGNFSSQDAILNSDTSTLLLTGDGGGLVSDQPLYNVAIGTSLGIVFNGSITITNNLIVGVGSSLTISAGSTLAIPASTTMNSINGAPINLVSDNPGTQTTIDGGGNTFNFDWLLLQDVAAINGTFNAMNTIDGGDNTGWNITAPITTNQKLFNGLLRTSVKTLNSLALASLKTFNGLQ